MAKKRKKLEARAKREEIKAQKEYEDTIERKRRIKSGYVEFDHKKLNIVKIILLALMPIAYFLYSVLLLPIVLLYGITYFITNNIEKRLNYGMRKELWVKLPKFDSIIAMCLVAMVVVVVGISYLTTNTQESQFAGKSETQIYAMLKERDGISSSTALTMAQRISSSSTSLTTGEKVWVQMSTLLTGQRVLFEEQYRELTMLGGRTQIMIKTPGSGNAPTGSGNASSGGGTLAIKDKDGNVSYRPAGEAGQFKGGPRLSNLPIEMVFSQIFSILCIVFVAGVFSGGIVSVVLTYRKKLD